MFDFSSIGRELRVQVDAVDADSVDVSPVDPLPDFTLRWGKAGQQSYASYSPGDVLDVWIVAVDPRAKEITVSGNNLGKLPVSDFMRHRYKRAMEVGMAMIADPSTLSVGENGDTKALSDLKGMYSRSYRKDQLDWYTVWEMLKRPHPTACKVLSEALGQAARFLKNGSKDELTALAAQFPAELAEVWDRCRSTIVGEAPRLARSLRKSPDAKPRAESPSVEQTRTYNGEKTERANIAHKLTVERLKSELEDRGFTPSEHRLVDVFCGLASGDAIFEVKSLTDENEHAQTRHAYAQVFYYRFAEGRTRTSLHDASLWAVFERRPYDSTLVDWLENDGVLVIWQEDDGFHGKVLPWDVRRGIGRPATSRA